MEFGFCVLEDLFSVVSGFGVGLSIDSLNLLFS